MPRTLRTACLALALIAGPPVLAQTDPMDPVEMRKRGFADMGAAFKSINDQLKRPEPIMMLVKAYAQQMVRYSKEPVTTAWFPPGSGPAPGVKTAAKAEIWEKPDDFQKLWVAYGVQAEKLYAAANARDSAVVKQAVKDTGAACAACHKAFRKEDH